MESQLVLLQEISAKLDKLLEQSEETAAQIAINTYINLASKMMVEVQREDGSMGHGLDQEALDKAYQGLQDQFYQLQEKLASES